MKASITRIRLYDCGIGCVNPGVSGKTTHGTRIADVLDNIRIAAAEARHYPDPNRR
jgi:hypothetical protein